MDTKAPIDTRNHSLASLLRPISLDTFFATYWEKNWLWVQRGDESYYAGLLTSADLEDVISSWDARYPAVMLAKNGVFYPPRAYCDDVKMGEATFTGVPNLKKLSAEYAKGATLALTSLDRTWKPLGELCLRLEQQLDHGVKTNVYVTAGQTTGFPPHYDTHEILLLQVSGQKRWRIFEPTIKLPDVSQACDPKRFSPGTQIAEIELNAGDLLYLPRGYGHAATTSKRHSAHVTVGIHVYTWASALKEFDASFVRVEQFREALPPGFASRVELRPAMKEHVKGMAPGRFTDGNLERALDSIIRTVNHSRRRTPGRFRMDASVISVHTPLSPPPAGRYRLTRLTDGANTAAMLALDFDANRYQFPAQLLPVLEAMCGRGSFRLQELPGQHGGEALVDLAVYLQSIGFLRASE